MWFFILIDSLGSEYRSYRQSGQHAQLIGPWLAVQAYTVAVQWATLSSSSWGVTASGLYGKALRKIAAQAKPGCEKSLKKDEEWEKMTSSDTGLVLLYK